MKSFLLAALAIVAVSAFTEAEYMDAFTQWAHQQGKTYAPEEFFFRYSTFKANMDFVERHNSADFSYKVELNKFADMTSAEFKALYLKLNPGLRRHTLRYNTTSLACTDNGGALDWTQKGAVTGVKDQGQCGSCWAFSTTGAVEGAVFLAHGTLTSLSEQELMDCSFSDGNLACGGGLMDNAFKYVQQNGLCSEKDYPYTARTSFDCKKDSCTMVAGSKISKYTDVVHTEGCLYDAVTTQPVSVAIEADQSGFQLYKSGVFSGVCGKNLDHGVLAVGYGTDNNQAYWKVKNSWGVSWGEQGYIRMIRGKDECGIADEPSYPNA